MDRTGAEVDANRTKRQKDINQNPIENSKLLYNVELFSLFCYNQFQLFSANKQTNPWKIRGRENKKIIYLRQSRRRAIYTTRVLNLRAKLCNLKWTRNFWDFFHSRNNFVMRRRGRGRRLGWAFGKWKRRKTKIIIFSLLYWACNGPGFYGFARARIYT